MKWIVDDWNEFDSAEDVAQYIADNISVDLLADFLKRMSDGETENFGWFFVEAVEEEEEEE